jgi:hypothetical protein
MTSEQFTASEPTNTRPPSWLASRKVWLLWQLEPNPDQPRKPRKMPYYAATNVRRNGELGSKADLAKLVNYYDAVKYAAKHGKQVGVAIVDGLAFVDLDDCLVDGAPNEFAQQAAALCPKALMEVSQSGSGLHLLGVTAKSLQVSTNRKALGFEAYTYGRFCAWTGALVSDVTGYDQPPDLDPLLEHLLALAQEEPRNVVPFVEPSARAKALYDNSLEEARRLLSRIPNRECEWDVYNSIMCALRNEFEGDDGLDLFLEWAAKAEKYDERTSLREWKSWKPKRSGKKFTLATLVHYANNNPPPGGSPPEIGPTQTGASPMDDDPYRFAGYMDDLLGLDFPAVNWVVDEFLPPGLTLLAGPPKTGKSRFNLQLALCVATGKLFLGQAVKQGAAVYLSLEDPMSLTQERARGTIKRLGINQRMGKNLYIAATWDAGEEAVARAKAMLDHMVTEDKLVPRLLVIDVLQRLRDPKEQKKPQYEVDYEALKPWAELRRDYPTLAIVITHHTRKAEVEDPFDAISGTQGLAGSADSMLVLRRPGKHAIGGEVEEEIKDRLLFYVRSRYRKDGDFEAVIRSERDLMMLTDEKPWELVGSGRQNEIRKLMETDPEKTWTSTEIHARVGENTKLGTTQKHLQRMAKKGVVVGDNGVGYRLLSTTSAKF